jgi:soluble cytochrome b562
MNDDNILKQRHRMTMERTAPSIPYSAKDFQLEVLDRLEEMRSFAEALDESWNKKLQAVKEQRLLKFDSRALIALGALALSITAYVIQDARNTARQDSELEATKTRVQRLEQIATTNTEARIRTEVQLGELRDGQNEIKALIQAHDNASRKGSGRK